MHSSQRRDTALPRKQMQPYRTQQGPCIVYRSTSTASEGVCSPDSLRHQQPNTITSGWLPSILVERLERQGFARRISPVVPSWSRVTDSTTPCVQAPTESP